jgi:hypothetical protein
MLGGIFEKNNIKDKIQTFDRKITENNFWKDKFSANNCFLLFFYQMFGFYL